MKRIVPDDIYRRRPCCFVAVGCALHITSKSALDKLRAPSLHGDGYLSLSGMDKLLRGQMAVKRRRNFKIGERPILREFCHGFNGKAVVCVKGHFVYVENGNYYSFFRNGSDEVIAVWEV